MFSLTNSRNGPGSDSCSRYVDCLSKLSIILQDTKNPQVLINSLLKEIISATDICRCYFYDCHYGEHGWIAAPVGIAVTPSYKDKIPDNANAYHDYAALGLDKQWFRELSHGNAVKLHADEFDGSQRNTLGKLSIECLYAMPVVVSSRLCGILGFDVCRDNNMPGTHEIAFFRAVANMLSTAFRLVEYEADLLEAHNQLMKDQRLESVGMLAGGIAHDFNNILMGILGYASLAKDLVGEDHASYRMINTIEQSGERAANLTRELLAYARGSKLDSDPVRLDQQVDDMLNILGTNIPKDIEIVRDYEDNLPYVMADVTQLQQVIMNLCINASDAIKSKVIESGSSVAGRIIIRAHTRQLAQEDIDDRIELARLNPGLHVLLTVSDNGCGMDRPTLQRIFDPFFTTKLGGRGLGLSAIQGIIDNHKGCLTVESEPGTGTTFEVFLPPTGVIKEEEALEEIYTMGGRETVLVIDDEEVVRQMALLTLTNLGYSVLLSGSARDGIRVYNQYKSEINLILADLNSTDISSKPDLVKLLSLQPAIAILITSGYDEETARGIVGKQAMKGFLQKPYTPDVLARAVRKMLDSHKE